MMILIIKEQEFKISWTDIDYFPVMQLPFDDLEKTRIKVPWNIFRFYLILLVVINIILTFFRLK